MSEIVRLPELRAPRTGAALSGWTVLSADATVSVPTVDDARRCAEIGAAVSPGCELRALAFDVPDEAILVALGTEPFAVRATLSRRPTDTPIVLHVVIDSGAEVLTRDIEGRLEGACGTTVVFDDVVTVDDPDGDYEITILDIPSPVTRLAVSRSAPPGTVLPRDRCAITLAASSRSVMAEGAGSFVGGPPLLGVDGSGCIQSAWWLEPASGRALVPDGKGAVELRTRVCGGLIASIRPENPVRDAAFYRERVVVLTATAMHLYDAVGCVVASSWVSGLDDAVALGLVGDLLVVVQRGTASPAGATNVRTFRHDGAELAPPRAFAGRGWYASTRSAAFVIDEGSCTYEIDPSRAAQGCCVDPARALTDAESAFFRAVSDLPSLRRRPAWQTEGAAVVGPGAPDEPLDSHRPGTVWDRVLLFGEIPTGCAIEVRTRASDDVLAGDPRNPDGWSRAVTLGPESVVPVAAPGDERVAAGDCMVLAGPGRFLWLELRLLGNGVVTPRVTSIEIVRPREGIARYLPRVYQASTPEDDFLRRWLALFETTAFDGVRARLDAYAELFDPRTAPERMLPYLARWLDMPTPDLVLRDPDRLRRILIAAPEIAELRGTPRGLSRMVRLYLDIVVRIRERFVHGTPFVLGLGTALEGARGLVLGCETIVPAGPKPTDLGDSTLGSTELVECDQRIGGFPAEFDVLVAARDVCTSQTLGLLTSLIDNEKPAHTRYRVVQLAPAGFVVGASSTVGQDVAAAWDADACDPSTYGIAIGNGPPRSAPIGRGLVLGRGSRLAPQRGQPRFHVGAQVGRTTRVGA